jgi:hypothetical protein
MSFKYNTSQLVDASKEREIVLFLNSWNPTKFTSVPITAESYTEAKAKRLVRLLHVAKHNATLARVAVLELASLGLPQDEETKALGLAPITMEVAPVIEVPAPIAQPQKVGKPINLNLKTPLFNSKKGVHNLVLNGEVFHPRLNPCEGACTFTRNPYLPYIFEVIPFEGVTVEWLWDSQLVDMGYKDGLTGRLGRVGITTHWVAPKSASGKLVGNSLEDLKSAFGYTPYQGKKTRKPLV